MAIDDKYACRNCAHYEGNCGHHFRNSLGHIEYDCPSEGEYDGRFICDGPACFEPNEEQIRLEREMKITELTQYSIDVLEEALSRLREKDGDTKDDKSRMPTAIEGSTGLDKKSASGMKERKYEQS